MAVRSGSTSASFRRGHKRMTERNGRMMTMPQYHHQDGINNNGSIENEGHDDNHNHLNDDDHDDDDKIHPHRTSIISFQFIIYRIRGIFCRQQFQKQQQCSYSSGCNLSSGGIMTITTMIAILIVMKRIFIYQLYFSSSIQDYKSSKEYHYHFHPRRVLLDNHPWSIRQSFAGNGTRWKPTIDLQYYEGPASVTRDSSYERDRIKYDDETSHCPFIADWQSKKSAMSNCNVLHEVAMDIRNEGYDDNNYGNKKKNEHIRQRIEHIDSGGFKDVWKVFNADDTLAGYVLKTTLYSRKFRERELNKHRKDALVMDEATSSPYVINMYGYCAYSSIVEAAEGTMGSWLHKHKKSISSKDRLTLAMMVAKGVYEMHLYHNDLPTIAHADIKSSQFLQIRTGTTPNHKHGNKGNDDDDMITISNNIVFKVNDFNRARFLTSTTPTKKDENRTICPFYIDTTHKGSTSRSPEEYITGGAQTDKIDVYSMGAIFYHILTGNVPYSEIDNFDDAVEQIKSGVRPKLSSSISNSTDSNINAIVTVMDKCLQYHSYDRPTSLEVMNELHDAWSKSKIGH